MYTGPFWFADIVWCSGKLISLRSNASQHFATTVIGTIILAGVSWWLVPYWLPKLIDPSAVTFGYKLFASLMAVGIGWILGEIGWRLSRVFYSLPEWLQGVLLGTILRIIWL